MEIKYLRKYIEYFYNSYHITAITFTVFIAIFSVLDVNCQSQNYINYINAYKDIAIRQQQEYGIPASITLAQGLLESGAGLSRLTVEGNNHFGIKCHKDWVGEGFYQDDDEANECFRTYATAYDSFEDHARFLKRKRYSPLFLLDVTDYSGWAQGLKQCGYATDPAYPDKLTGIIEMYNLYQYDSNQPIVAQRKELKGDETLEHSIEQGILDEVIMMHPIKRKWGIHYVAAHKRDKLSNIATEFGISVKRIANYNDYEEENVMLKKGDIIYLEEKFNQVTADEESYTVKSGETLHSISQRYGIKLKYLLKLNNLGSDDTVNTGDIIKLK